jgi:glyoxalase family protein
VKVTVNFDDPGTYHLYYGDPTGAPGTILTFFPWQGMSPGRVGSGETGETTFLVPSGSLAAWQSRLSAAGVPLDGSQKRLGRTVLRFRDPDGMALGLTESEHASTSDAIIGFHSVTLCLRATEATEKLLTEEMGFVRDAEEDGRLRFRSDAGTSPGGTSPGAFVDLLLQPSANRGRQGAGTVHHVAFRSPSPEAQDAAREALVAQGLGVTEAVDRTYFRSIYFREPGGVLFEIATDPPGFAVDEAPNALGTSLRLPPQHERLRPALLQHLPKLKLPTGETLP